MDHVGKSPVFEFSNTLTDSLEVTTQLIAISVQPIESFIPFHVHNYVEMMIPIAGNCVVTTKNESFHLKQDDFIVMGNRTIHRVEPIKKGTIVVNLALKDAAFSLNDLDFMRYYGSTTNISSMLFSLLASNNDGGSYSLFKTHHDQKIITTLDDVIEEYYHPDIQTDQIIRFEILTLFARLVRIASKTKMPAKAIKTAPSNLLSLLLYIEKNYSYITLEAMAAHFGFNPNYLSSYLKRQTGLTFIKLVHLQRINVAAEYLTNTNISIEEIAAKIGYENPSYFYKVFRDNFGCSPNEYRKRNQ
ncbi:transcriptional regulator-type [Lactobacillus selangorensis]|uniref:Transcriptional regulator-type n=1 Tax=Lactobacillus selangorensis TaxID=81857 RepID=A0A0R2FG27_9LACO|nr:transcriptional regulator-type [Lactobacillus selangorensis]